jgi:gluconolactonase
MCPWRSLLLLLPLLLLSCGPSPNRQAAELLGANATWGNTEGPAIDSKGTLYFTSRGAFKGIVSWNETLGFQEFLPVATKEGPGGLFFDAQDNLYATATGERQILKITPDKKVSVLAENFDLMPAQSKGPNDLTVANNGVIYFTVPNGYDGKAPKGTVYRLSPGGKPEVFSQEITGPNGIILSPDQSTLYVAHNVAENTSHIVRWKLPSGPIERVAVVEPCQADGMDVDRDGNIWLTCYAHGAAHLIDSNTGRSLATVTTGQKALTNCKFGRGAQQNWLYLTSSDMDRVTGYIYRARVPSGGFR